MRNKMIPTIKLKTVERIQNILRFLPTSQKKDVLDFLQGINNVRPKKKFLKPKRSYEQSTNSNWYEA